MLQIEELRWSVGVPSLTKLKPESYLGHLRLGRHCSQTPAVYSLVETALG